MRALLLGIGNPGRQDDGLGPALAEAVERLAIPGVTVDADYQLTVEDAAAVAEHEVVVFADADAAGEAPFSFRQVEPVRALEWSSHGVEPETLLGLVEEIFGRAPPAYVLGIRGRSFGELREELSDEGRRNLAAAVTFVEAWLRRGVTPAGRQRARGRAGPP
jgi:hydrogenase maturation protease